MSSLVSLCRNQLARVELSEEEEEAGFYLETLGPDYEWEGVVVIYCGRYDKEVSEYGNAYGLKMELWGRDNGASPP